MIKTSTRRVTSVVVKLVYTRGTSRIAEHIQGRYASFPLVPTPQHYTRCSVIWDGVTGTKVALQNSNIEVTVNNCFFPYCFVSGHWRLYVVTAWWQAATVETSSAAWLICWQEIPSREIYTNARSECDREYLYRCPAACRVWFWLGSVHNQEISSD